MTQPAEPAHERPDLRLLLPAAGAWFGAAVALGLSVAVAGAVAGVLAALGAGCLLVRSRGTQHGLWVVAGVALCAAGAIAATTLRVAAVGEGPLPVLARDHAAAVLQVVVTADPKTVPASGPGHRDDLVIVTARAEVVEARGERVRVRAPVVLLATSAGWAELLPSQRVRVEGRLTPPRPGDLVAATVAVRGPPSDVSRPSLLQRTAGRLREGLRRAADPLPRAERGLLPGLVEGDTSRLEPALYDDFRTTGLTHVTAVSGSNVAIVLGAVLLVARWLRCGRLLQGAAGVAGVIGFVVLARPDPSVLRAAFMGLLTVAALVSGRRRSTLPALCAAVLALVYIDPTLARSVGFTLSVLATGGLVVLAPIWGERLARWLPRWLAEAVAIPAAAGIATAPVIVAISGRVSLVSVPANLLAGFAVAPATILGLLAALTAPWCLPLAQIFAAVGGLACAWIIQVAHVGARVPGGTFGWSAGAWGAATLTVVTAVVLLVAPYRAARRGLAAGLVGVLVAFVGVHRVAPGWPPPGWVLVACDVGQGDALVLDAGAGTAVVVDAGPDPASVDRCLTDLGIRRVALVLLSHLHADHVEGLPGVLRGRQVAQLEVGPLDEPPEEWVKVRGWANAAGVPTVRAAAGESRSAGDLRWRVLAPQRAFHGTASDPNNSSIVLRVEVRGVTVLLTGDVEPPAQETLLESGQALRADVLKVPHHGSAHQDDAFLAAVGARVALVSVGAGNDYGHPSARTLSTLARAGAHSFRTDLDGDIAVLGRRAAGGELKVVGRHGAGTVPASQGTGAVSPGAGAAPASHDPILTSTPWDAGAHGSVRAVRTVGRPRAGRRRRAAPDPGGRRRAAARRPGRGASRRRRSRGRRRGRSP